VQQNILPSGNLANQALSTARLKRNAFGNQVPLCILLVFFASFLAFAQAQNNRKTLRTVREVNDLGNIEARNAYPVQLEGVATYSDPEWGLLFLEDETGAIYVNVHGMSSLFPAGSRIRVDAVTGPGDVGTVLVNPRIQVLSQGALPTPEHRSVAELNAKKADSRFVQTQGVLRAGDQPWTRICFRIFDGNTSALVVVPQAGNAEARRLVGATVQLRGVSGVHIDSKGKVVGALIFVNHLEDIEVESGEAHDPNALAVVVNKSNPTNDLSMAELRRILLGDRKFWRNSDKIVLLLPTAGTAERKTALHLLDMDESNYQKYWLEKTSAGAADTAPATAPASGIAVNLVAETDDAIAVVPLADVKGSVKVLRIDGFLPSDSAYPVH
jgi:hypothetical protein